VTTLPELVVTERRGQTLIVTLNKPAKLNALSPLATWQLSEALDVAAATDVRAVVVTGAGRGFCAGVDLNPDPAELVTPKRSRLRYEFGPIVLQLAGLGKPVVAAVNGVTAGAGLGLAVAADVRVASTAASFRPAFINIGSVPDMGASYHVPRLIGYERAFRWLLSGETMSAEDALAAGLVSEVVEPEALLDTTVALCESFVTSTTTAVRLTKQLLRSSLTASLAEQLDREAEYQPMAAADPERAAARKRVTDSLGSRAER